MTHNQIISGLKQEALQAMRKTVAYVFATKHITPNEVEYQGANADARTIEIYFSIHLPNKQELNYTVVLPNMIFGLSKINPLDDDAKIAPRWSKLDANDIFKLRIMYSVFSAYKYILNDYYAHTHKYMDISTGSFGIYILLEDGTFDYKLAIRN